MYFYFTTEFAIILIDSICLSVSNPATAGYAKKAFRSQYIYNIACVAWRFFKQFERAKPPG